MSISDQIIAWIWPALSALIAAGLAWLARELLAQAQERLGIRLTDQQKAAVYASAETASNQFMADLSRGATTLADAHPLSAPVAALAQQAFAAVQGAATALGETPASMARILVGRIGDAISTDPTINTLSGQTTAPAKAADPVAAVTSAAATLASVRAALATPATIVATTPTATT
jgi:hypothetical protein